MKISTDMNDDARGTPEADAVAARSRGRDIEQQDYYAALDLARSLETRLAAAEKARDSMATDRLIQLSGVIERAEKAESERDALKHDIERHVQIAAEQATEMAALKEILWHDEDEFHDKQTLAVTAQQWVDAHNKMMKECVEQRSRAEKAEAQLASALQRLGEAESERDHGISLIAACRNAAGWGGTHDPMERDGWAAMGAPDEVPDFIKAQFGRLHAKIDALMLEYCPDEMTEVQKANWAAHQRPATAEETAAIDAALSALPAEVRK